MRSALVCLALVACYLPDKQDCTAGQCAGADAMADEHVTLVITVSGPGTVTVDGLGTCDSHHDHGCMFDVPARTQRSLVATPANEDKSFDAWSGACAGQPATCALVPAAPTTTVGVRFE